MAQFPRIFLAIDNCFASKRWTAPAEWAEVIAGLGITRVEASADNECDPLYSPPAVLGDWVKAVKAVKAQTGVEVVNLYSGHGTYATLGLAHPDERVRDHILHQWLVPMTRMAGDLGAGLGFFTHAFAQSVLEDPEIYNAAVQDLYQRLAVVAAEGAKSGAKCVGVEQMYTPHQIPWTVEGAKTLLRTVFSSAKKPFYLTIDTGHQSGQRKFLRPDSETVLRALAGDAQARNALWVGASTATQLLRNPPVGESQAQTAKRLEALMDATPHLFAEHADGNPYHWLEHLACYAPIIHLQQTDGKKSAHLPFSPEHNKAGIIRPTEVLAAIAKSYQAAQDPSMPPRCHEIHLTLELFSATADRPADIIDRYRQTVEYWRQFIPEDGLTLDRIPFGVTP